MTKEIGAAAINLAIETTQNAIAIEDENKNLKDQLSSNMKLLDDLDVVIPRAKLLQQQLKEKKDLIEQKRQELVELQKSVITALIQKPVDDLPSETSLEAVPIIMNRVQRFITDLSETAVDNKTLAVSILSLVKVNEALDRLYDAAVDSQVIKETKEESEARKKSNSNSNQEIINTVRENITNQQQILKQQQLQQQQQQQESNQESQKEQSLKRDVLIPSLKDAAETAEEEEKPETPSKSVSFPAPQTITPSPVASVIAHRPPTPEPDFEQRKDTEALLSATMASETNDTENKE